MNFALRNLGRQILSVLCVLHSCCLWQFVSCLNAKKTFSLWTSRKPHASATKIIQILQIHQLPLSIIVSPSVISLMGSDSLVLEQTASLQSPYQTIREAPAHGTQQETSETVIVGLLKIKPIQVHSVLIVNKRLMHRCVGSLNWRILDMLRKSFRVIAQQVSHRDDAVQPQWRVSLLLSA